MRYYEKLIELVGYELDRMDNFPTVVGFICFDTDKDEYCCLDHDATYDIMEAICRPEIYPLVSFAKDTLHWLVACGQLKILDELFRKLPNHHPRVQYFLTLDSIIASLKCSSPVGEDSDAI